MNTGTLLQPKQTTKDRLVLGLLGLLCKDTKRRLPGGEAGSVVAEVTHVSNIPKEAFHGETLATGQRPGL